MTNKQIFDNLQTIILKYENKCNDSFEQESPQVRELHLSLKNLLDEIESTLNIRGLPENLEDLFDDEEDYTEEENELSEEDVLDDLFDSLLGLDDEEND